LEVYGADDRIGGLTKKIGDNSKIDLGSLTITCLYTPCHTTGHICYYVPASNGIMDKPAVFTGDTLFIAGCGRFFEGTGEQMYAALYDKLGNLPNETLVFCGHEYTVANLKFSVQVEPSNAAAQAKLCWAQNKRSTRLPTVPSTIGEEKEINPFMRVGLVDLLRATGTSDPISCMTALRNLKNNFKA
jgi:hydroxyacylglutathione hydrolase